MKIKINDILECVNRVLDKERLAKNLEVRGHFVHVLNIEKHIGTIKTFHARVDFVNHWGVVSTVVGLDYSVTCPIEQLEEIKEKVLINLLENFFFALRMGKGKGNYENFVNGTFEGWT